MDLRQRQRTTLTQRLVFAFTMLTLVPTIGAAWAGVTAFERTMEREGLRTVTARMERAQDLIDVRLMSTASVVENVAEEAAVRAHFADLDETALGVRLSTLANRQAGTYYLALDSDGNTFAGSGGASPVSRTSYLPFREALRGQATRAWDLIGNEEIEALGLGESTAIAVRETPKGTVIHGTLDEVLALVVVVPVTDDAGTVLGALMAIEPVNRSSALVESIVGESDSEATIFQHEVRVSTTVTDESGQKAYGTVVSDPVRIHTLEGNKPFRGEAVVVGQDMFTAYDPIIGPTGEPIGMLFVGVPLDPLKADRQEFLVLLTGALVVSFIIAAVAGNLLAQRLSDPLRALGESAQRVAGGDLTEQAKLAGSREIYELGQAFNLMSMALAGIIQSAKVTSSTLRAASDDTITAVRTQAEGAGKQASAVSETTATLEEMAATYRSVAASAERVLNLAEDALETAQDGHRALESTIEGVMSVSEGSERTREAAEALADSASDIGEVLGIIDSIAAQTKILALNAAIEAARAGEAGKGFGVVATEIRTLAESVTDSTARIESLLATIKTGSDALARAAAQQEDQVSEAANRGRSTEESFSGIVDRMSATTAAAREITKAAEEQRAASEQVVQAMHQVSSAASETAAASRQVEASVSDALRKAEDLDESLRGFRVE